MLTAFFGFSFHICEQDEIFAKEAFDLTLIWWQDFILLKKKMSNLWILIQTAVDNFDGIEILVNNAGIGRDRMVFNLTEEEWDDVINVHLNGQIVGIRGEEISLWSHHMKERYAFMPDG